MAFTRNQTKPSNCWAFSWIDNHANVSRYYKSNGKIRCRDWSPDELKRTTRARVFFYVRPSSTRNFSYDGLGRSPFGGAGFFGSR